MYSFPIDDLSRTYSAGYPRWRVTDSGVVTMELGIGATRIRDSLGQSIWAIDCRLDGLTADDRDLIEDFCEDNRASEFYWYDPLREKTYEVTFDAKNPPQVTPRADGTQLYDANIVLIPAVPTAPADTLVAHYLLNDDAADTTVADDTGNGHTGTASRDTSAMTTTGKINGALNFNGTDDYVNIPDHADLRLTGGGTIMAWIKPDSLGETAGRIVDKSTNTAGANGYLFTIGSSGKLTFQASGGTSISVDGAMSYGEWLHVAVTFDGVRARFYVNGVLVSDQAYTTLPPNVAGDVRIGQRAGATDRTFDGAIDDVRIYKRPLMAAEVALIYNGGDGTEGEVVV